MTSKTKLLVVAGIVSFVALALAIGGLSFWFVSNASAQAATTTGASGSCHDNGGVLQLLKLNKQELVSQRQAGKSLLEIAKSRGATEAQLLAALAQPVEAMHASAAQKGGDANAIDQMTQQMREQTTQDIQATQFGTMTDYDLGLGGTDEAGMMGGNQSDMMNGADDMMDGAYDMSKIMNGANDMMGSWTR